MKNIDCTVTRVINGDWLDNSKVVTTMGYKSNSLLDAIEQFADDHIDTTEPYKIHTDDDIILEGILECGQNVEYIFEDITIDGNRYD